MSFRPVEPASPDASLIAEEEQLLDTVRARVALGTFDSAAEARGEYEQDLLSLRDQLAEAKPEDQGPLVEQMMRIQAIAARRGRSLGLPVDPETPYFAHLRLKERDKERDVLIGKRPFIDRKSGVQIVDWRNAPVSRIYYRYEEGDDYDEDAPGGRLEGLVDVRRSLSIGEGKLKRISSPRGLLAKGSQGWFVSEAEAGPSLQGGQGTAARPPRAQPPKPGGGKGPKTKVAHGAGAQKHGAARQGQPGPKGRLGREERIPGNADKHLPEIAALIDKEQFGLITDPNTGIIVIQGGAGSGKTTVALHRVAFLAFREPQRFTAHKMLVIVPSKALARYVEGVLPSLDVRGVPVTTTAAWAESTRRKLLPSLGKRYVDNVPTGVSRLKKHPALLGVLETGVARQLATIETELGGRASDVWRQTASSPPARRVGRMNRWLEGAQVDPAERTRLEGVLRRARRRLRHVSGDWIELLTDRELLTNAFRGTEVTPADIEETISWMVRKQDDVTDTEGMDEERFQPIDGRPLDDEDATHGGALDPEDDPILLRLYQLKYGGLILISKDGSTKDIRYEHIVIDEAQDLAAIEVKVLIEATSADRSVTIAGDVSQRLVFDNAFTGWEGLLQTVGHAAVEVKPLRLSYRSTAEVMQFARHVLGPLADPDAPLIARNGAPVELHTFTELGELAAFLGEALRGVMAREPTASVAVLTRHAGQADVLFQALGTSEVPGLRRVRSHEFVFAPGVDVTDVTQVKGLEFDYVVMPDLSRQSYPDTIEARHLLHIGATRAAHQLWLLTAEEPSPLLPPELIASAAPL